MNMYYRLMMVQLSMMIMTVAAYPVKVKNNTASHIEVKIDYQECESDEYVIRPGQVVEKDMNSCCIKMVYAMAADGALQGEPVIYTPPITGKGVSCQGFNITIEDTPGHGLEIVRGIVYDLSEVGITTLQ